MTEGCEVYNTCRVPATVVFVLFTGLTLLLVTGVGAVVADKFDPCSCGSSGLAMAVALAKVLGAAVRWIGLRKADTGISELEASTPEVVTVLSRIWCEGRRVVGRTS